MRNSLRPRATPETQSSSEFACFAHAAARVLQGLTATQSGRWGEDLLDLVDQEAPVAFLNKMTNREKPAPAQLRAVAEQLARQKVHATELDRLLGWVGDLFGLDDGERAILAIFARWGKFSRWRELVRRSPQSCGNLTPAIVARLSGLPITLIEQKFMSGAPLLRCRLLHDDRDGEFNLSPLLRRIIRVHVETREELLRWLMPDVEVSALNWDDFEHLGPLRDVAHQLLSAHESVSLLLYGEPGTGKTEFARALAAKAGSGAIFAGLSDDVGNEPDRSERLDHLMLLRAMCRHRRDRTIVVDEADDVLMMSERKGFSKQWINRLVEEPQVTTIWIVNDRSRLDPAVLRRMTLAIGFERPRLLIRERIVTTAAASAHVLLSKAQVGEIAGFKTCPAVVASGLRVAQLSQGGADVAKTAIQSVMRALGQSCAPEIAGLTVYDPHLSRADTDLARLAERLTAAPDKGWSLLLSGPSGTGKSAFARHLASKMGLEVEELRCSDLMSPYVGQTEQNIAEAFARAAERGALLLIDEADSFLYRREAGQRSWEVSQVNEMLVQMEHLRTPFVATTNLADKLDPATQRRFTLRAAFQPMTMAQARQLFSAHFAQDWPVHWPVHEGQTPGDFAVVAHRARLLGEQDPSVLLGWLSEEIAARGDQVRGTMGFQMPSLATPIQCHKQDEQRTPAAHIAGHVAQ